MEAQSANNLIYSFDEIISTPSTPRGPKLPNFMPVFGGTDHLFLTKMAYVEPAEGNPRVELTLEQRLPGEAPKSENFQWNDWRVKGNGPGYPDLPKNETFRLFFLVKAYRPDLTDEDIKASVRGLGSWKEIVNKCISLLPANYSDLTTTWYIRFRSGSNFLEIPEKWYVVRQGNGKTFKFSEQYDLVTPQAPTDTVSPSAANEFNHSTTAVADLF